METEKDRIKGHEIKTNEERNFPKRRLCFEMVYDNWSSNVPCSRSPQMASKVNKRANKEKSSEIIKNGSIFLYLLKKGIFCV